MGALQQDLRSTQTVMGGQLQAAEETMGELQTSHQALADELRTSQAALREEIRAELREQRNEAEVAAMQLQTSATQFTPPTTSSPTGTPGGPCVDGVNGLDHSVVQRPPPYDGQSAWDTYATQFDMLARVNHWTELEKTMFLAVSLRGPALMVLSNLTPERRYDYQHLVTALQNRFGAANQAELNRMKLKGRTRRREESLPELLEDIERLVRLAYPEAAPEMLELLAKDHFIDSLPDEDKRLRIRQNRPHMLQETPKTALNQLASRQRAKTVREVHAEGPQRLEDTQAVAVSAAILVKLQQCMEALQHHTKETVRGRDCRKTTSSACNKGDRCNSVSRQGLLTCWNCGEHGHMRRECKKAQSSARIEGGNRETAVGPMQGNNQ